MDDGSQRNLFAATAASFLGFTGFTIAMPFLPLYVAELGVTDVGEVATWTGLSLGITPAITALCSPFWGRVADRFGRKLMVERALASFVVIMTAMAFVTRAWHIVALRALQGLFAGYGAMTVAMAAESVPRHRMAAAIGRVQTAQRLGPAVGPILGGVVAQAVGLRRAFFVTAGFYAVGLVLVQVMYHESSRSSRAAREDPLERVTFRSLLAFENFLLLMAVVFGLQFVDRSLGPILPLFLTERGVRRVALMSGLLFSVAAGAGAIGNTVCARVLHRLSARQTIAGGAWAACIGLGGLVMDAPLGLVACAMACIGFGIGLAMTGAYAAGGRVMPEGAHGFGFGMLSGASLAALAVSPMAAGLLSGHDLRLVFVLGVLMLAGLAIVVGKVMTEEGGAGEGGVPSESL